MSSCFLLPLVLINQGLLLLQQLFLALGIVEKGGVHGGVLAKVLSQSHGSVVLSVGVAAVALSIGIFERELVVVDLALKPHLLVPLARFLTALDELVDGLPLGSELLGRNQTHRLPFELLLQNVGVGAAELLVDAGKLPLSCLVLDVRPLSLSFGLGLLPPLQQPQRPATLRAGDDLPDVVTRLKGPNGLQGLGRSRGHGARAQEDQLTPAR
mmetsp:Transcript_40261/g.93656  ORF Transcript_40261/g.93656 Transcript_40261/m.93656 type:complete len:212 (+) Transcript_40261:665-1300(+)